jgi:hypothetical protein
MVHITDEQYCKDDYSVPERNVPAVMSGIEK